MCLSSNGECASLVRLHKIIVLWLFYSITPVTKMVEFLYYIQCHSNHSPELFHLEHNKARTAGISEELPHMFEPNILRYAYCFSSHKSCVKAANIYLKHCVVLFFS